MKSEIESLLSGKNTNCLPDARVHAATLKMVKALGDLDLLDFTRELIMGKRSLWVDRYMDLQRSWQATNVNRFHDSFELRESYIGCHTSAKEEWEFEERARDYNRVRKPTLYQKRGPKK